MNLKEDLKALLLDYQDYEIEKMQSDSSHPLYPQFSFERFFRFVVWDKDHD